MTAPRQNRPWRSRIPALACFVLGLLGTLPLVVLTPPFRVPDEPSHFYRAYQVSEGGVRTAVKDGVGGGTLPSSLATLALIQHFHLLDSNLVPLRGRMQRYELARTLKERAIPLAPERTEFIAFSTTVVHPPLSYLPQAAGIVLGRLFGAGPLVLLYLARLANALTAVILLSLAIDIMPFGRPLALLGGLLPMALYEYASASADAIVISGAFLVTALELRAFAEGRWRRWEVIVTALAGLIVCSTKPVYAPLLLIAAPAALVRGQRRNQLLALAVILLVAVGGAGFWFWFWFWENAGRFIAVQHHTDVHAQLRLVVTHPLGFIAAMAESFRTDLGRYLREMIGILGWLTLKLPAFAYLWTLIGLGLAWFATGRDRIRVHAVVILWWLLMFAGAVTLTMLALYLSSSPVGAAAVVGIQGRYFIPLLALVAAMAAAVPAPRLGRRIHALLFPAVSIIVALNVAIVIARVCLAYRVLG